MSTLSFPSGHSLLDELLGTMETGDVKQRLRVLRRVTDLFVAGSRGYSKDQVALFDDVLQRLSADIEIEARARLSQRLADLANAPPVLIRTLAADDEIKVAGPVLTHSPQLTDADLVDNANSKSQDHLLAIAHRLKLSEAVTDVLVERGNNRVVRRVAKNAGARFSLAGYEKLTIRAQRDRRLTLALGERSDIPRHHFLKLLETASAAVRARLEAANPAAAGVIRDTVDDIATVMQREAREASGEYSAAAQMAVKRFRRHQVTEANVHGPAHAQEFERTAIALAKLGNFPVDMVERALLDEGADMILVLARAADCSWSTVKELLQMYAAKRRLWPDDLAQAADRYRRLSQATARNIVDFHNRRIKLRAEKYGAAPAEQMAC